MAKLINILLRKTDPDYPWGFGLGAQPPALHSVLITWVDENSLAAEHLQPGDRVLEIEGMDTTMLSNSEVEQMLNGPSQKLELLIMKKSKPSPRSSDEAPLAKTTKTKETLSSKTEEFEERKILSEDSLRESKVITTEGTLHKQIMETVEHSEKEEKTDTFWTCAPADLIKQEAQNVDKYKVPTIKANSGNNYISESSIFKNLNNYRDEQRKIDPREEKRRFWENCHKDSVRKFKWGDSVKLNQEGKAKTNVSTECLYNKSESEFSSPTKGRSKSCEPSDAFQSSNPFSQSRVKYERQDETELNATNPFYVEFEKYKKSTEQPLKSYKDSAEIECDQTEKPIILEGNRANFAPPEQKLLTKDFPSKEAVRDYESNTIFQHKNAGNDCQVQTIVVAKSNEAPTKVSSKEEFETKCKFFEKATSVPVSCVNKNAKEIVEERLRENATPTAAQTSLQSERSSNRTSVVSPVEQVWNSSVPFQSPVSLSQKCYRSDDTCENAFHSLKKPSDFLHFQWKTNPLHQVSQSLKRETEEYSKNMNTAFRRHEDDTSTQSKDIQGLVKRDLNRDQVAQEESFKYAESSVSSSGAEYPQEDMRYAFEQEQTQIPVKIPDSSQYEATLKTQMTPEASCTKLNNDAIFSKRSRSADYYESSGSSKTTDSITTRQARIFQDIDRKFDRFFEGLDHDSVRYQRGGSLGRDFFEKKTFRESSFEKVVRSSKSPYENVESSSTKEYKEEVGPFKTFSKRSATPADFYDNAFGEEKDHRAKSPLDISWKSFEDIRKRLGSLLGAEPTSIRRRTQSGGFDHIENAFHNLAVQEGIISSAVDHQRNERQSSQIGANARGPPGTNSVDGPPPPPPLIGNIPNQKLASEIAPMKKSYEPPAAIQNAMMTKDKKPFTYTPGGLDLAEIRSPRMAKRISRNAHMEDSCTPQQQRVQLPPSQPLPPSALAAMQPQIAIPVFPPGGCFPNSAPTPPTPPPPPPPSVPAQVPADLPFPPPPPLPSGSPTFAPMPPPPPPLPSVGTTAPISSVGRDESKSPQQNGFSKGQPLAFLQDIQNRPQLRSVGPINQNKHPADFVAEIPNHSPLKPVNHPPRSSYDPASNQAQIPIQLKQVGPKVQTQSSGVPFIPQPMSPEPVQPIEVQQFQQPPPPSPTPAPIRSVAPPGANGMGGPPTPAVNRGPAPWMTTRQTSRDAPPPWVANPPKPASEEPTSPQPSQYQLPQGQHQNPQTNYPQQQLPTESAHITRVIPIQIEGRDPPTPVPTPAPMPVPNHVPPFPTQYHPQAPQMFMTPQQQQYIQQQQQFLQQQQKQQQYADQQKPAVSQPQNQPTGGRTHIIPIQIEGQTNQQSQSPVPFAQRSNSSDSTDGSRRPLQTQTSWTGNPTQSRSFRVLQKITGSEDEPTGPFAPPTSETFLVNRVLPPQQAESPGADNSKCWNPNTPPPISPYPNFWYYPPQTPEEQQQFWDHYNAMYAYMAQMNAAAYRYSPYPMYPYPYMYPSDNEEYSGYSSSDEMTYYGQMFKKQAEWAQAQQASQTQAQGMDQNSQPETETVQNVNRDSSASTLNSESTEVGDASDDVSETDTEIDENQPQSNALRSIKSVPNIHVYNESNESDSLSESDDESDDSAGRTDAESDAPQQLSVIYEESEQSDVEGSRIIPKKPSESTESCDTLQSNGDDEEENDNSTDSTVTVRLPLQLSFSRSSNNEEVATVIVGNSEVESAPELEPLENLIITEIIREDSDPDITATICLKRFKKKPEPEVHAEKPDSSIAFDVSVVHNLDDSVSNSPVDFWKELSDKERDSPKSQYSRAQNETPSQTSEDDSKHDESDYHSSSTSIQTVKKASSGGENMSGSETETSINNEFGVGCRLRPSVKLCSDKEDNEEKEPEQLADEFRAKCESEEETESSDEEEEEEEEEKIQTEDIEEEESEKESKAVPVPSNQSKHSQVQAQESIDESDDDSETSSSTGSSNEEGDEEDEEYDTNNQPDVAKKDTARAPSRLETRKSQEESEEDDSGVTSDLSRHISETDTDPECGGELRRMSRYQRAATHSRLFKLLQEECKVDESPEEEPVPLASRKERLTLPLQQQFSGEQESLSSSSGINSPSSPTTTDRLVKELIKSLLSRKKGRHFRKLPLEKLHAAALRILQEDMDPYDTASTSDESANFLSPVAAGGGSSRSHEMPAASTEMANPEAYGGNYYDYCRYYSTWGNPENYTPGCNVEEYEILPSKAFRILQENTQPERYSSPVPRIAIPVRCPRVSHPPPLQSPPEPPPEIKAPCNSETTPTTSQET